MRVYPVYCTRPQDPSVERIGSIIELRRDTTPGNLDHLNRLARRQFGERNGGKIFVGETPVFRSHEDPFGITAPCRAVGRAITNGLNGLIEKERAAWLTAR